MRVSSNWKDFEILDATGGMRLERWGNVLLQRPDPQVIWQTPQASPLWGKADGVYHRSEKGGGNWTFQKKLPEKWTVSYGEMRMQVGPMGFKHMGVFPEQAGNWDEFARLIAAAKRPVKVLNLFAYTGCATLACAKAGAAVTHVDASKGMVAWAKENAALNFAESPVRWIVDDCAKFVKREAKRGNTYDAIILDPPSYGRGPTGEIWKLEDTLYPFLQLCADVLSSEPLFVCLSSYTTGLAPGVMAYMLESLLAPRFGGRVQSDEIGLPVSSSGLALPCGASAIHYFVGQ